MRKKKKKHTKEKKSLWRNVQDHIKEEKRARERVRSHKSQGGRTKKARAQEKESGGAREKTISNYVSPYLSCVCFQIVGTLWTCRQMWWILAALLIWVLLTQAVQEHSFPPVCSCYSLRIQENVPTQAPFVLTWHEPFHYDSLHNMSLSITIPYI